MPGPESDRLAEKALLFEEFLARFPSDEQALEAGFRLGMALYHLQRHDQAGGAVMRQERNEEGKWPTLAEAREWARQHHERLHLHPDWSKMEMRVQRRDLCRELLAIATF